jgi:dTDP-4-dehydrorhamnose 3,5-epimerase
MEIQKTPLKGLLIIQPQVFEDDRGFFFESYNEKKYDEAGIDLNFIQDNLSKSQKGVLRGLHFQSPPHAQDKLVQVIKGAVLDVAVDIRKDSETYGRHFAFELNEENKTQMLIPVGFAHGFLTLRDDTIFSYKCSDFYKKEAEGAILWNDEDLDIEWNIENPIVSAKDKIAQSFKDFHSPF